MVKVLDNSHKDLGKVEISPEVLISIASIATSEIDGLHGHFAELKNASPEKLNRKNLLHNYIPHPSKTERNKFTALPLVQAINRLNQVGYGERAGLLYRYLMTQLNTPESLTLLAQLAQKQGDHYHGGAS